jgi:type IV secretion system protein TrbL
MDNVGVIDRFLNTFTTYIDSGFGLIHGEVGYLTSTLIVIDITLAGLFWAWGADEDIIQRLVKKTLYIGFFAFIIGNFNHLAHLVFDSFAGLGLKAGGSSISINQFLQPGHLAQTGLDAGKPLLTAAGKLMGFRSFFANFVQIAVLMVSWVLVLIAFFILAVQLFVTILEFKLTTLAGFVLIPFALFNKTAFLAEKVLGNVVASGVKVLVLAVIVGIGTGLFSDFTAGWGANVPTDEQALSVVLAALSLLGLGIFGPGIANGLISGAPQLGAGAAVGTGLAVAGIGAAGYMGARAGIGAVGAVANAAGATARGAAFATGGARSAYGLASASSGQHGAGGVAAGLGGVAKAGAGAAMSPLRRAAAKGTAAVQSSYQAGGRAALVATGGTVTGTGPAAASRAAANTSSPPAWAQSLKRRQAISHGVTTAAHAVRAGDHGGASSAVNLDQENHT